MKRTALTAAAALLPLTLASPAWAVESETITLEPLNNTESSGTAELVYDEAANTLAVNIDANNLVPNLPHAQHIHIGGRFECPTMSEAGGDGIISTVDGKPAYGEIQISLTTEGDFGKDSALAVERFPVASASGEVSYERVFDLSEVPGGIELQNVSIVQHGIDTISPNGEYGPKPPASSLNPDLPLETTAPANCGSVAGAAVSTGTQSTTQTGQMPSGGVQTGAGGTAGLENEGLLTLGALGLLGAAAVTVRRRASDLG
jgi:hypothetical protein